MFAMDFDDISHKIACRSRPSSPCGFKDVENSVLILAVKTQSIIVKPRQQVPHGVGSPCGTRQLVDCFTQSSLGHNVSNGHDLFNPHESGVIHRGQLPVRQPLAHHLKQRLLIFRMYKLHTSRSAK